MDWLTLISLIIRLVTSVVEYLGNRASIDKAAADSIVKALEKADDLASAARAARNRVLDSPADILVDPDNRDNRPPVATSQPDDPGANHPPSGL